MTAKRMKSDTPNLAFTVQRPGLYRISVDATGNSTALLVRHGQGEVTGGGVVYPGRRTGIRGVLGNDELSENRLKLRCGSRSVRALE